MQRAPREKETPHGASLQWGMKRGAGFAGTLTP